MYEPSTVAKLGFFLFNNFLIDICLPVNRLDNSIKSRCVLEVLGSVANKKHMERQSSTSLRASINDGYLK